MKCTRKILGHKWAPWYIWAVSSKEIDNIRCQVTYYKRECKKCEHSQYKQVQEAKPIGTL